MATTGGCRAACGAGPASQSVTWRRPPCPGGRRRARRRSACCWWCARWRRHRRRSAVLRATADGGGLDGQPVPGRYYGRAIGPPMAAARPRVPRRPAPRRPPGRRLRHVPRRRRDPAPDVGRAGPGRGAAGRWRGRSPAASSSPPTRWHASSPSGRTSSGRGSSEVVGTIGRFVSLALLIVSVAITRPGLSSPSRGNGVAARRADRAGCAA